MKRSALVVSALALVVLAPGASAGPRVVETRADGAFWSATANELWLRGSVGTLAADGDRVAFSSCGWVGAVWQPGRDPHFFDGAPTADACTSAFPSAGGFSSFAVAGDRVAYFRRSGGIGVFGDLDVASAHDGYQVHAVNEFGRCCAGDPLGSERWGDLVGGGDTLAYATWEFCGFYTCGGSPVHVTTETVSRIDDACSPSATPPCPPIASSTGALVPLAAARGQVLFRRAGGTLELRSSSGTVLRTFRLGTPLDATLAGRLLVVLIPGALRVVDVRSGHLLHRWPLRAVPLGGVCIELPYQCPSPELQLAGAAHGLAAYVADGVVHVVRLADGLDVVIARATQVQITSAGLFYAYTGRDPWPGRVRFVPRAQLFRPRTFPGSPVPPARSNLFAQTTLQLFGPFPAASAGSSIAAAGDVNGDGRPDIVVGAVSASPLGRSRAGSAFVVFGARSGGVLQLAKLGARGFEIDGSTAYSFAGQSVAGVGDINGDRLADVAVSEYPGGASSGSGRVAVVLGSRHPRPIDLAAGGADVFSIDGLTSATVAAAGDVNRDHLADILVCCTQTGASAVIFGTRTPADVDVNALGDRGFLINGATNSTIAGVGDMNGDGLADVALADLNTYTVSVVYGKRNTAAVDLNNLGTGGFAITGPYLGVDLAGVHDVNGDGLADLAVTTGAPNNVAVVFGSRAPHPVDTDRLGADGFTIEHSQYPIGAAGDLNGDGLADIAVRSRDGTSIVFGQGGGRSLDVNAPHFHGFTMAGIYGPATAVGDMNGDGQSDLLVAPGGSNAGPGTGTLYLFSPHTRGPLVRATARLAANQIIVDASCNEPCTVSASADTASTARVYLVQPRRRATLRLESVARVVVVRAVDDAGNVTTRHVGTRP
jgi:FG-GAP-like repeat/FG-GAP repeat